MLKTNRIVEASHVPGLNWHGLELPDIRGSAFDDEIDRTDAGALIPEEVTNEIFKAMPRQSAALTLFQRRTMSRKQLRMPVLSLLAQAYWVGGDTGLKQTTKQAWENKFVTAEELAVIVPVPEAVLDDASYDIFGEVRPSLVEAIGQKIDQATFFGVDKPASWPDAVVPAAVAAGNVATEGDGADLGVDIGDTMSTVEEDGYDVNGFAAGIRLKGRLRNLRASGSGELLFQPALTADTPATLFGEEIAYLRNGAWEPDDALLIAGDFRGQGIIAVRQDLRWKLLDQAVLTDDSNNIIVNLAQQDMVALRVTFRVGFQVANPVNREQPTEDDRYPFGVLEPAAT